MSDKPLTTTTALTHAIRRIRGIEVENRCPARSRRSWWRDWHCELPTGHKSRHAVGITELEPTNSWRTMNPVSTNHEWGDSH